MTTKWQNFPYKTVVLIGLIVGILGFLVLIGVRQFNHKDLETAEESTENLPVVEVTSLRQAFGDSSTTRTGTLTPASSAPLVARTGGQVTAIQYPLGSSVSAGQTVIQIDGANVANPTRVQISSAQRSLAAFQNIKSQTINSSNNAIAIAQQNLDATSANRQISRDLQQKNQQLAANAVRQAQASVKQTTETKEQLVSVNDQQILIQAAQLGVNAAELSQDQATLQIQLQQRQNNDALQAARRNVEAAQIAKQTALAQLNSQEVGLRSQLALAREQYKLSQVSTPITGRVNRLTVQVGDFIQPGQTVGEVLGQNEGAQIDVSVPRFIYNNINEGLIVDITTNSGQKYSGKITHIAVAPNERSLEWQVKINVTGVVNKADLNQPVNVVFPGSYSTGEETTLVPINTLVVRENGILIFTVDQEGIIHEHTVTVRNYFEGAAEVVSDLSPTDTIVLRGGRTLRDGQKVSVQERNS